MKRLDVMGSFGQAFGLIEMSVVRVGASSRGWGSACCLKNVPHEAMQCTLCTADPPLAPTPPHFRIHNLRDLWAHFNGIQDLQG